MEIVKTAASTPVKEKLRLPPSTSYTSSGISISSTLEVFSWYSKATASVIFQIGDSFTFVTLIVIDWDAVLIPSVTWTFNE